MDFPVEREGGVISEGGAVERRNGRNGGAALSGQDHSDAARRLRLLILNRRDVGHPLSGGAEVYLEEVAQGFLNRGWAVDWFASAVAGAPAEEVRRGIRVLRRGSELTTHAWGHLFARRRRHAYRIILDGFNGLGYLTAGWPNSILMIFQLYGREFWVSELGAAGHVFAWLERRLLRAYRRNASITISDSTRHDLEGMGLRNVAGWRVGLARRPAESVPPKPPPFTLVYVGRLRVTKNPEEALRAFGLIRAKAPEAQMIVVGRGPDEARLRRLYEGEAVRFAGYVADEEKYRLLGQAHLALVPSIREGWNMVVTEAAAMGTPCIAYRVPGIVDSVRDGLTGVLVEAHDVEALAAAALAVRGDPERHAAMCRACLAWAGEFSWEKTRDGFADTALAAVPSPRAARR